MALSYRVSAPDGVRGSTSCAVDTTTWPRTYATPGATNSDIADACGVTRNPLPPIESRMPVSCSSAKSWLYCASVLSWSSKGKLVMVTAHS